MVAAKNSRKRRAAWAPASATSTGTTTREAVDLTTRDPEIVAVTCRIIWRKICSAIWRSEQTVKKACYHFNTFANYPGLKEDCTAWMRPKPATLLKICANKTGSGFSGSIFIVSVTYLEPRH